MLNGLKEYKREANLFGRTVKDLENKAKMGEDALLKKKEFDRLNAELDKRADEFKNLEDKLTR